MYPLFVFVVLFGLIAAGLTYVGEQRLAGRQPSAEALAQDFSVYRTAVIRYAQTQQNAGFAGSVPNQSLPAVGAYVPNPLWRNYVQGKTVVVYAASVPTNNFVGQLEDIAQHSVFAGAAYNGTIVSNSVAGAASNIALPAGIAASVPNGTPVWEALDVF